MAASPEPFELFTSLRYDPILLQCQRNSSEALSFTVPSPFYMLRYHRDRMLEAARYFEWDQVATKLSDGKALEQALTKGIEGYQSSSQDKGPLRIRVLFTKSAELKVECYSVPPVNLNSLYPPTIPSPVKKPFHPSPLTGGALTTPAANKSQWFLHLDKEATPSTAYTSLKTTNRSHYNVSRERSLPSDHPKDEIHEVLLYNTVDGGEMTEGSLTSVYFWRGGRWVTPPVGNTPLAIQRQPADVEESAGEGSVGIAADQSPRHEGEGEGDRLPSFRGRWGHSLRSSSKHPDSGGQRGTTRRWALRNGLCVEEVVDKNSVNIGDIVWVSNGVRGFAEGKVVD